jgi:pyruvate dehydrogenase E1 component beta subunit
MPIITYRDAVREALEEEMQRDERVFLMGEEVAQYNGAYKCSRGLLDRFGPRRVIDTPITEESFAGIGIGAAMAGLRPVVEFMTFNFAFQAFDQIVNNAAKMRYMSGGQLTLPIVFRGPNGPAEGLGSQHSHQTSAFYTHLPGIKVVAPSNPRDAKGLLKAAIRDDNPVVVLEGELMYAWKGEVPEGECLVPLGAAEVKRAGTDLTLITYGRPIKLVMDAAEELSRRGVAAEVIDLRSLRPLDRDTLLASVNRTHRCVIVEEAWPMASVGAYIGWLVANACFDVLDAQVELVASDDVPMPYNHRLELAVQPTMDKIMAAVKRVLYL